MGEIKKPLCGEKGRFSLFIRMNCEYCKKEFEPRRKDQIYCRKKCRSRASEKRTGALTRRRWKRQGIHLSIEEFETMEANQGGCCQICRTKPVGESLRVDHDHSDGTIRGLLCHKCNTALGYFSEKIETLESAIEYLKNARRGSNPYGPA
jgi:hypothetical protein